MGREDLGHTSRFNFARINSEHFALGVPTVAQALSTATDITSAMPLPRGLRKSGSSVTSVPHAVRPSRVLPLIDCPTEPFALSGCWWNCSSPAKRPPTINYRPSHRDLHTERRDQRNVYAARLPSER